VWGVESACGGEGRGGVCGTLLGPEGTRGAWFLGLCCPACAGGHTAWLPVGGWVGVPGGVGVGLLFENCTVDASIFVVKLLRAYGGCLGTRGR
jgi:hypothetical protein